MDTEPPTKPAIEKRLPPEIEKKLYSLAYSRDPQIQRRYDTIDDITDKTIKRRELILLLNDQPSQYAIVKNYGPISKWILGDGWSDHGIGPKTQGKFYGGLQHWLSCRVWPEGAWLRIYDRPEKNSEEKAQFYKDYLQTHIGPVDKSDYEKFQYLFGASGNPNFVTVESVDIVQLGGKKVITMSAVSKDDGSHQKFIYVSLDDWTSVYKFGLGETLGSDFQKDLQKFDQALTSVVWKEVAATKNPLVR